MRFIVAVGSATLRSREHYGVKTNAVHLRPSRRISREARVHNLKIEFEFELDFRVSTPAAPNVSLVLSSDKKSAPAFPK